VRRTETDAHWSDRAASVADDVEVNIMDIFQRELEYDEVGEHLEPAMRVLEVGCGNGFSTRRFRELVTHVDAFDYSPEMVERARTVAGETNNRFFVDNVLALEHADEAYDAVVCIRVLINLRDLAEQRTALREMAARVRAGGILVLAEGFTDGFAELNIVRERVGLPPLEPAAINFYSALDDLLPELDSEFDRVGSFHLGAYDYLTRVFYPLVAGVENAKHNTVFSERASELARAFNPQAFETLSRLRGFVLRKRQ